MPQATTHKPLPLAIRLQTRPSDYFGTTITNNVSPTHSCSSDLYTPCSVPEHLLFPMLVDSDNGGTGENLVLPPEDSEIGKKIYFPTQDSTTRFILQPRPCNELWRHNGGGRNELRMSAMKTPSPKRQRCAVPPRRSQRTKYESVPDSKLLDVFAPRLLLPHLHEVDSAPRLRLLPRTSTDVYDDPWTSTMESREHHAL